MPYLFMKLNLHPEFFVLCPFHFLLLLLLEHPLQSVTELIDLLLQAWDEMLYILR